MCHGKPYVRHMRWPVETVLDLVSAGMSATEIQAEFGPSGASAPLLLPENFAKYIGSLSCNPNQ
ncbi:DUF433 domain-containing protein [uncultured Lamprocystis sp.]|uniref:DUF433 domain-containing protein n=1 Tax=uncultured Lamprocystis sp. TaxID=543132 RepID=UPI0025E59921|nr:DUF433 domain-containing protein [uncultured Lamprocystis sp.]